MQLSSLLGTFVPVLFVRQSIVLLLQVMGAMQVLGNFASCNKDLIYPT